MKLVWDKGVKSRELYDVARDRAETNNLAADRPEQVAALSAAWSGWATKTGLRVKQ